MGCASSSSSSASASSSKDILKDFPFLRRDQRTGRNVFVAGWVQKDLVTTLPATLKVEGNLDLHGCTALTELPENMKVGGNLNLQGCTGLKSLPSKMVIGGDLLIANCKKLVEIPKDLKVSGNLDCRLCENLETIHVSEGGAFNIGGRLDFRNCKNLKELPKELKTCGDLNLSQCTSLTTLPEGLTVEGNLNLEFSLLTTLPTGLNIHGDLNLYAARNLKLLPEVKVQGDLDLRHCTSLTSLPDNLSRIEKSLKLDGCTKLVHFPPNLNRIGRNLSLVRCSNLEALPETLRVGKCLYLNECEKLLAIPNGVRVGDYMSLKGCSSISTLPDDLRVEGHISLERCTALTSISDCVFNLPLMKNGQKHFIFLGGSGISEETLNWLRERDFDNLRFIVDLSSHDSTINEYLFSSLDEAISFWANEAEILSDEKKEKLLREQTKTCFQTHEKQILLFFLSKLKGAKEFGISKQRKPLAKRVVELLEILAKSTDESTRNQILIRMSDSLDACNDKPIWALNQIQLTIEISKARGDKKKLKALGKRVMRLNIVHEHAKRKCDSLSFVDDVCVYLRYEIDLKDELDLPVSAMSMYFPNYIKVEAHDIEKARKEAMKITEKEFETFLDNWSEWQRQLRLEVVDEVSASIDSIPKHRSISVRKSLRSILGNHVKDPVVLGKTQYSWNDLKRHWIETGMDFNNRPWPVDEFKHELKFI